MKESPDKWWHHWWGNGKPNGVVTARVLSDGTTGISVKKRTRTRDQERAPSAAGLKRSTKKQAKEEGSEAHRQVPINEGDWHLLGCQVRSKDDVYVNSTSTFGVASASYHWYRAASTLLALLPSPGTCSSPDLHLQASGAACREALLIFLIFVRCQAPRCLGTRQREVIPLSGSASNCYIEVDNWASLKGG